MRVSLQCGPHSVRQPLGSASDSNRDLVRCDMGCKDVGEDVSDDCTEHSSLCLSHCDWSGFQRSSPQLRFLALVERDDAGAALGG